MNDWGDAVRDDTIEALGYLDEVLNELIDESSDLQVSMVRTGIIMDHHPFERIHQPDRVSLSISVGCCHGGQRIIFGVRM